METNIIQRPKKTSGALLEAYSTKVSSSHFRIHLSIKTFAIAAFESNNRNATYKRNKITENLKKKKKWENHISEHRNKILKHFRTVYSIEANLSSLKFFTVSTENLHFMHWYWMMKLRPPNNLRTLLSSLFLFLKKPLWNDYFLIWKKIEYIKTFQK